MERVQMCRLCLVEDAPMYVVVNRKMHEVYEKLTNKQFVTEDRRPVLVCYFCCSRLKQCCHFQRQCLEAEVLFAQMLDEDYELNPSIKPDLGLNNGFIISPMELISIVGECQTESHVVKEEVPVDCKSLADIIEPTEELQVDGAPAVKKSKLHIRRKNQEDVLKEEHKKCGQSDSKVIRTTQNRTRKPWTDFKEPLIYTKRRPYNCDICQRSFTQKCNLKRHIRMHTGERRKRRTKLKDVLAQEQKKSGQSDSKVIRTTQKRTRKPRTCFKESLTYTKRRQYNCDICQRSFTEKSNLKRHIRIHTGEKPYKCEVCQYSFNVKSNLTNHIRIHTGEKPYKCEICQYRSYLKGDLTKHVRKHTNSKPFKCELCQYSCNQNSHLVRHLRIHTGEKPYKCEVCQRGFNQKNNLTNHIRRHTGEKPFTCDICQYSCIQKSLLIKHIRIHTKKTLQM